MPIMWWTVGRITTGSSADKQENGGICKIAACHRFLAGKKCLPMGHITCVRGAGSPVDIMCPHPKEWGQAFALGYLSVAYRAATNI